MQLRPIGIGIGRRRFGQCLGGRGEFGPLDRTAGGRGVGGAILGTARQERQGQGGEDQKFEKFHSVTTVDGRGEPPRLGLPRTQYTPTGGWGDTGFIKGPYR